MKMEYIESLGLPKGFKVNQYEDADIAALSKEPAKLRLVTDVVNKYLRQKDALVQGRDDLAGMIEAEYGFAPKTATVKTETGSKEVWDETEGKYIARFVAAVVANTFTSPKLTVTGTNAEQREAQVWTALQALADKCGDEGKEGYTLDINVPERKPGKAKNPPQYAIEGATTIINNGNEAAWVAKFTKGFKSERLGVITPVTFEAFDTKAPKGASAEEVEKVRNTNIRNLAFAIAAVEEQGRKNKAQKEYV